MHTSAKVPQTEREKTGCEIDMEKSKATTKDETGRSRMESPDPIAME
jgi:hypothetical protein